MSEPSAGDDIVAAARAWACELEEREPFEFFCVRVSAHFARAVINAEASAAPHPDPADILAGGVLGFSIASYVAYAFSMPFETVAGLTPAQLFRETHSPAEMADQTEQIIELYNELHELSGIPTDLASRFARFTQTRADTDFDGLTQAYGAFRASLVDALAQEMNKGP